MTTRIRAVFLALALTLSGMTGTALAGSASAITTTTHNCGLSNHYGWHPMSYYIGGATYWHDGLHNYNSCVKPHTDHKHYH